MRLLITSDHAGLELRQALYGSLKSRGFDIADSGPYENDPLDDYPDFVAPVALEVSQDPVNTHAIVIGGSGQGEAIMANRFPNVRAVVFNGQYAPSGRQVPDEIVLSRVHNDSNILSLGARFLTAEEAMVAVLQWLETPFAAEERHVRRIRKIEEYAPAADTMPAETRSDIVHEF